MDRYIFMIFLLSCFFVLFEMVDALPTKVITTTSGRVRGKLDNGIREFLGIPYATPPVGDFRFKNPEPHPSWSTIRECTSRAESCPQIHLTKFTHFGKEDCLYLDIYAPKEKNSTELLPIMFWIYGGGFVFGDAYEFGVYNVKHLVEMHDMIIVSVGYRLGPFAFMALDELAEESPIKSTGNNALLDQVLALKWTNDNIRAFGGDPDRITIMGESAGAFSVCWHMVSPLSNGLFSGAIMESGTCDRHEFFRSYEKSKSFSQLWADTHGCNNTNGAELLKCLRKLKINELMSWENITGLTDFRPALYPVMPWAAVIDGTALPDNPMTLINADKFNRVPLLIGTNHDEGTIFIPGLPLIIPGFHFPLNAESFDFTLMHFFFQNKTQVAMIKEKYPVVDDDYNHLCNIILRDTFFLCSTRRIARAMTQVGHESIWMYQFTFDKGWFYNLALGDFHASELLMVFDNYIIIHPNNNDTQMAKTFHLHWTNMVKYGSPNSPTGVVPPEKPDIVLDWPVWDLKEKKNMDLNIPPTINFYLEDTLCDFWDTLGA